MDRIPTPPLPMIDLTDEASVYQLPEDRPRLVPGDTDPAAKDPRKDHHFTKKSQAIAGRVVHRKKQEEEEEELRAQMGEKDPFNLSNDEYYLPKSGNELASIRGTMIQVRIFIDFIALKF